MLHLDIRRLVLAGSSLLLLVAALFAAAHT